MDIKENLKIFASLIRAKQYVKNLLIFAPIFFSHQLFNIKMILGAFVMFISMAFVSSFVYIINDIIDKDRDKNHPKKSKRPIQSGKIGIKKALLIGIIFLSIGLTIALVYNIYAFYILLFYLILNIFYCLKGKNIAIIDIIIISIGYVLRLFLGSISVYNSLDNGITLSKWIIIMTFLLALFLSISKRYDDLTYNDLTLRESIKKYNKQFIEVTMGILASVIIVSYIQYTIDLDIINQFSSNYLYLTSVFVIMGLLRYLQLTFVEKASHSPCDIIYKDNFLKISILLWIISFVGVIYL